KRATVDIDEAIHRRGGQNVNHAVSIRNDGTVDDRSEIEFDGGGIDGLDAGRTGLGSDVLEAQCTAVREKNAVVCYTKYRQRCGGIVSDDETSVINAAFDGARAVN